MKFLERLSSEAKNLRFENDFVGFSPQWPAKENFVFLVMLNGRKNDQAFCRNIVIKHLVAFKPRAKPKPGPSLMARAIFESESFDSSVL